MLRHRPSAAVRSVYSGTAVLETPPPAATATARREWGGGDDEHSMHRHRPPAASRPAYGGIAASGMAVLETPPATTAAGKEGGGRDGQEDRSAQVCPTPLSSRARGSVDFQSNSPRMEVPYEGEVPSHAQPCRVSVPTLEAETRSVPASPKRDYSAPQKSALVSSEPPRAQHPRAVVESAVATPEAETRPVPVSRPRECRAAPASLEAPTSQSCCVATPEPVVRASEAVVTTVPASPARDSRAAPVACVVPQAQPCHVPRAETGPVPVSPTRDLRTAAVLFGTPDAQPRHVSVPTSDVEAKPPPESPMRETRAAPASEQPLLQAAVAAADSFRERQREAMAAPTTVFQHSPSSSTSRTRGRLSTPGRSPPRCSLASSSSLPSPPPFRPCQDFLDAPLVAALCCLTVALRHSEVRPLPLPPRVSPLPLPPPHAGLRVVSASPRPEQRPHARATNRRSVTRSPSVLLRDAGRSKRSLSPRTPLRPPVPTGGSASARRCTPSRRSAQAAPPSFQSQASHRPDCSPEQKRARRVPTERKKREEAPRKEKPGSSSARVRSPPAPPPRCCAASAAKRAAPSSNPARRRVVYA